MKGDFTRETFDPAKQYSRVLMQQGRVTLDADFNEQSAILLHHLRMLTRDLIGPYAAPSVDGGFLLAADPKGGLLIGAGRYYVDGILVENLADVNYAAQPYFPLPANDPLAAEIAKPAGVVFWLYLDVWERHVTWIEDPTIRESALQGPDTCTRAQIVWQVRALPQPNVKPGDTRTRPRLSCDSPLGGLSTVGRSRMAARLDPGSRNVDPCLTAPDAKYRGLENQLYRIEVHTPGKAGVATFKWSRDNGSVAAAWLSSDGNALRVSHGRGFAAGDWVELSDDRRDLAGVPGPLVKLVKVEGDLLTVDSATVASPPDIVFDATAIHPKVRRWNQSENARTPLSNGAIRVVEPAKDSAAWIDLEDGLQVQFDAGGEYRAGDYWLIPARVATGDIEWPSHPGAGGTTVAESLPPRGIEHHYAPLGYILFENGVLKQQSCRCTFDPLSSCFMAGSGAVGQHLVRPASGSPQLGVANTSSQSVLSLLR